VNFFSPENPHWKPASDPNRISFIPKTRLQRMITQKHTQGCSGITGKVAGFTDEGSSRNLMYNAGPSGRGTLRLASPNPIGTGAERLNSWSEATAVIRNRFEP